MLIRLSTLYSENDLFDHIVMSVNTFYGRVVTNLWDMLKNYSYIVERATKTIFIQNFRN